MMNLSTHHSVEIHQPAHALRAIHAFSLLAIGAQGILVMTALRVLYAAGNL